LANLLEYYLYGIISRVINLLIAAIVNSVNFLLLCIGSVELNPFTSFVVNYNLTKISTYPKVPSDATRIIENS
jgi:hypothetical protein